jgi:hypothetical protein
VREERHDERRVEVLELQPGWRCAGLLAGERQQQPEGVAVGGDRVRAGLTLVDQPLREERLKRRCERRS